MIEFRNCADLYELLSKNLFRLPTDLDVVVGIPRSGMLPATIISLQKNLPLADLDGFFEGRVFQAGARGSEKVAALKCKATWKVLVVDDSVCTGRQIREIKKRIDSRSLPHDIFYAVAYGTAGSACYFDYCFEILSENRVFGWNIMHSWILANSCVDIDGVLCRDPSIEENDDGARYREFLDGVEPLIVPSVPIGSLVTCRLEKYRGLTEDWLARQGVTYKNLVMMGYSSKQERERANDYARYKAMAFTNSGAALFVESSLAQARAITALARKPVFCFESQEMIYPDPPSVSVQRARRIEQLWRNLPQGLRRAIKPIATRLLPSRR